MDDTSHRSLTTIINIGHRTGDGTCSWNTAEERRGDIGQSLCHQLCIGIVMVADHTICHGSRKQTLDGTENSDGDGRRHQVLDGFPVDFRHLCRWQFIADRETVSDGLDACHTGILFQDERYYRHQDNGDERTRNLLAETRSDGNDNHAHHTDEGTPRVDGIETLEINAPFLDKVRRIAG